MEEKLKNAEEDFDMDDDENEDDLEENSQWKRHYGNSWVFLLVQGEPVFTIGPHWPMNICMLTTFIGSSYFLTQYLAPIERNVTFYYVSMALSLL